MGQIDKIQELLLRFDREDEDISGVVVFDIKKGKELASTFSDEYTVKTIKIEQMLQELDKDRILKLDPAGPKNWAMYSYDKKIIATVRVKDDICLSCEYSVERAPSAAIEDALEIALMVNQLL